MYDLWSSHVMGILKKMGVQYIILCIYIYIQYICVCIYIYNICIYILYYIYYTILYCIVLYYIILYYIIYIYIPTTGLIIPILTLIYRSRLASRHGKFDDFHWENDAKLVDFG